MPRPKREVPWLDRHKSTGRYYVHWYDENTGRTERLSLRTADADEAQDRYVEFIREGRSILRSPSHAGVTVTEVMDWYLRDHAGIDPYTGDIVPGVDGVADKYRVNRAAEVIKMFWEDTPVESINVPESRRYRAWRENNGCAPSTARRELNALIAACNHAIKWDRLTPDKLPRVELPPHSPVSEAKYLTKEETKAVILAAREADEADPRLRAFTVLAYLAGARRRSIERLTRPQVRFDQGRLHLTPDGAKRTKKRAPVTPINEDMAAELRRLIVWSNSEYLFGSAGYDVRKKFTKLVVSCGIERERAMPHILRHSRATHMLQDGESLWDVAKLLGDTVETIERVYGHHCPDHMGGKRTFSSLSNVLG
ncbi:MAG: site-specific integrase [Pseudomonadota bacterium]